MKKIQFLITQYSETDKILKSMLDSIEMQKNINKDDVEVLIGNDGSDVKISESMLKSYSYSIRYLQFEHTGLPGCRQNLFDKSEAEYIMYCDADDAFTSTISISVIMNKITQENPDIIVCDFIEENPSETSKSATYFIHKTDSTFVHGKVYRREFLMDNQIKWYEDIWGAEDGPYNALAQTLSKKTTFIELPIYMWQYNPDSIVRKNPENFVIESTSEWIRGHSYLIEDLLQRGLSDHAKGHIVYGLYYAYNIMKNENWYKEENEKYKNEMYKQIAAYYRKWKLLLSYYDNEKQIEEIKDAAEKTITQKYRPVLTHPLPSFEDWLRSIIALF